MKTFVVLLYTLALFLGFAVASPKCNKNAWVSVYNTGIRTEDPAAAWGMTQITSGLHSNDISWNTMHNAITDCMFNNQHCFWDKYEYNCATNPAWIHRLWTGTLNIHFDCSGADYVCTEVKWERAG